MADCGELWRARRGSGPFKTSQGRRGRRVGVSVACGIEGRPGAAARAGAWPGLFVATAASRRAIEAEPGRSVEEALMAGSGRSDGTASGGSPSAASAAALLGLAKIEKEEREERSTCLTRDFLKIFHGNSKKFEHESRPKLKILQFSFQAKIHLSNDLKVILNFQKL